MIILVQNDASLANKREAQCKFIVATNPQATDPAEYLRPRADRYDGLKAKPRTKIEEKKEGTGLRVSQRSC